MVLFLLSAFQVLHFDLLIINMFHIPMRREGKAFYDC